MTTETRARDPGMPYFNPLFAVFLRRQLVRAVEAYRKDGRKFARLDGEALQKRFISAFDAWVCGEAGGALALNDVNAEYLLRRKPAPLRLTLDRIAEVFAGSSRDNPSLAREPQVLIALGRWLYAPFVGGLLAAKDEPDDAAATRDFHGMIDGVAGRQVVR
jgi:hypothetical protein